MVAMPGSVKGASTAPDNPHSHYAPPILALYRFRFRFRLSLIERVIETRGHAP